MAQDQLHTIASTVSALISFYDNYFNKLSTIAQCFGATLIAVAAKRWTIIGTMLVD